MENHLSEENQDFQEKFLFEKIKQRPINKKKLIRRTLTTAFMAVMFGTIACVTFILFEPIISNRLNPPKEETPQVITFPEDNHEKSPEEMLTENMQQENQNQGQNTEIQESTEAPPVLEDKIQEIMDEIVLDKNHYEQFYSSLSEYVKELNQSMVTITGVSSNIDWFNDVQESRNVASGVILANNGIELLIVSDYKSLKNAEVLSVTFCDNTKADASLKVYDAVTDLAVISVRIDELPEDYVENVAKVTAMTSSYRNTVGTPVIAIGNPMGTSGSVGYGMITSISSQMTDVDTNFKLIQTDIAGSSSAGGMIFNLQGQLVGIITNDRGSSDMKNFISAYGISELRGKLEKMSNGKNLAYLGITGLDVTAEAHQNLNVPYGAYIRKIDMDSPAMLAGMWQGDVVVKIDTASISSFTGYVNELLKHDPQDTVKITVMRQGKTGYNQMEFNVTLGGE